ncbi:MAG: ATP-binding cassette domain-containing protein [Patulibacter sp.]
MDDVDPQADVETLSHGQRQRLELEMVLAQRPSLVVLDEPTAGMTRSERSELAALIRAAAGHQTFLVVEHDMDFVSAVADRVSFMRDGQVVVCGTFEQVVENPEVLASYLGEPVKTGPMAQTQRASATQGALAVTGLTVFHGHLASVRGVGFDLPAGGSLGVIGRNGAGKTTLLDGLMGSLRTEGSILLDGEELSSLSDWERARLGLAIVPQGKQLFKDLTVADNLRLAELDPAGPGRPFDIHELFPAIAPLLGRKAGLLSGGEQQQVAIARALLRRPRVLLLDEPTEGISPIVIGHITEVLRHLVAEGLSLILADQHRSLVEALCDEFIVLRSGERADGGAVHGHAFDHYDRRL